MERIKKPLLSNRAKAKSERRGSNPRLAAWEATTLPTELRSHLNQLSISNISKRRILSIGEQIIRNAEFGMRNSECGIGASADHWLTAGGEIKTPHSSLLTSNLYSPLVDRILLQGIIYRKAVGKRQEAVVRKRPQKTTAYCLLPIASLLTTYIYINYL